MPLKSDPDGVLRIGGTRVTLETVIAAFQGGATPEEIAQRYPTVRLADIYQTIGYYLDHTSDLAPYLERRHAAAAETRRSNESRWPSDGLRKRLLTRRRK